jgi:hypothetical protein
VKRTQTLIATIVCAGLALALPLAATAHTSSVDVIHTFLGDGDALQLDYPRSMVEAPDGGYLVVDTLNSRIQKVDTDGNVTTVAGTGNPGYDSDNQPATDASLNEPRGVAVTPDGGFLIADTENMRVRKVAPDGTITTVAGNGTEGQGLLGGLLQGLLGTVFGTDTELDHPSAVAVTPDGGFLIADTENNVIRKVGADGQLSTAAGDGSGGYSGDGADAGSAQLCTPEDVAVTPDGGFLIADTGNHVIRKVAADGTISTVAGDGVAGYSGDNGAPEAAELNAPAGVEVKPDGSFLVADTANNVIRKVKDGVIKTKAGDGADAFAGDGGDPSAASLSGPKDVLVSNGVTFIADSGNNRIRKVVTETVEDGDAGSGGNSGPGGGGVIAGLPGVDNSGHGSSRLPEVNTPTVGEDLEVDHQGGSVKVKLPGSDEYVILDDAASIPMGSVVDASRGRVTLTSAKDNRGTIQRATFHGGLFQVRQKRAKKPVTELVMRGGDFSSCWRPGASGGSHVAQIARKKRSRRIRHLWGSGHGRFKTRGRHGAATVRGTIWLTEDSCAGTRVTVRRGLVAVSDFARHRRVMVPKHHSYLARVHPLRKHRR